MRIRPDDVASMSFDWGSIKWFVTPASIDGAASSLGEVIVNPGRGHARHNHPAAEEVIYVISGEAMQMVADGEPFPIREGDAVHIPAGVYHSTHNTTWRPLRLIVTYTPGGEEKALEAAPDYGRHEAGTVPQWTQSDRPPL
jgi:oxalate decarboxylase/phosphoglucose isomerase-like protein (cupin superfamily)